MVANIELVVLSFFASIGFAIVFQIRGKDLIFAGLGGALTRIVFIIAQGFISNRIAFSLLAAVFAALYAQLLASIKKCPSTYYLYPTIIPLIPADLLFYALGGLAVGESDTFTNNITQCIFQLIGITVGFVVASTVSDYARRVKFLKNE